MTGEGRARYPTAATIAPSRPTWVARLPSSRPVRPNHLTSSPSRTALTHPFVNYCHILVYVLRTPNVLPAPAL
jgi:hypothetical protein